MGKGKKVAVNLQGEKVTVNNTLHEAIKKLTFAVSSRSGGHRRCCRFYKEHNTAHSDNYYFDMDLRN